MTVYQKIASISPVTTELLLALGAHEKIVGIAQQNSSRYPMFGTLHSLGAAAEIQINDIKNVGAQAVFATPDSINEHLKADLAAEGIDLICLSAQTMDQVEEQIFSVARSVAKSTEAEKLVTRIQYGISQTAESVKDMEPIRTAFFTGREPYTVAAGGSLVTELLSINAMQNVYGDIDKVDAQIDLSTLKLLDPQLILLPSSPVAMTDDDAFTMGQYTEHALTVFVPGEMFTAGVGLTLLGDFFRELNEKMRRFSGENLANRGVPTYF